MGKVIYGMFVPIVLLQASYTNLATKQLSYTIKHTKSIKKERLSVHNYTKLTKIVYLDYKHLSHTIKH